MDLIQYKKLQKVHVVNHENNNTICGKVVISNPFFAGSGHETDITCSVCGPIVEEERRIEEIERANYDGMTYKEYQAHVKARSMGKSIYGNPLIVIEDENGKQINSLVITPESLRRLYG